MRQDCEFTDCLNSDVFNSFKLTNKPDDLNGYSDISWTDHTGKNCYKGHGGQNVINYDSNIDYSKNTLEHCKRACFDNLECNCITYHSNSNKCYMRKIVI